MNCQSDQELLEAYARHGAEPAFAELVRRHVGLVYAAATRLVVDPHLAEDVTQAVFIALARNARELAGRKVLSGWLHFTTRNVAANTVRTEVRRRAREQVAALMPSTSEPEVLWDRIAPQLDAALAELNEMDRDTLMLRFFEGKTAREIGECLGLGEEAAQKRVERAMDRLREVFATRGVVVSAAALPVVLSLSAAHGAPAGLAATVTAKVLATVAIPASLAGTVGQGFNVFAWLKLHPIAAAILLAACLSLGTAGFVTGRVAGAKHRSAVAWQQAVFQPVDEGPSATAAAVSPERGLSAGAPNTPGVGEILAQAAQYFRSQETDPDALAKGLVTLEAIRPEDAALAVQQLEAYRNDPAVFNLMGPPLAALWARTNPRGAIEYSLANFKGNALGLALERVTEAWARHEPADAWTWYRQTTDSGKLPIAESTWHWLVKPIFTEWAVRDVSGALAEFAKVSLVDKGAVIHGIAEAVRNAENRPALLAAIARLPEEEQRRHLAVELVDQWARGEPQAAVQWAMSLSFENPIARIHIASEAVERWLRVDPHAAAVWLVRQAPGELRQQFGRLMASDEFKEALEKR